MARQFGFDYDYGEDSLFIYDTNRKVDHSMDMGELIVDLDKGGAILGLELLGAAGYLGELANQKITRQDLRKTREVSLSVSEKMGTAIIRVCLKTGKKLVNAAIAIQNPKYRDPELAYA